MEIFKTIILTMNNKIIKINLNHSFIFFLFCNLFSLLVLKLNDLIISTPICLLLILIIGVSHGALDHMKGKKHFKILNIKNFENFFSFFIIQSSMRDTNNQNQKQTY